MEIIQIDNPTVWHTLIEKLPGAHALQTWQWGQVKAQFGWEPFHCLWRSSSGVVQAAALLLQRKLSFSRFTLPLSVLYIPRGPLLDWTETGLVQQVLADLEQYAQQKRAIFIKIDPDLPVGFGIPGADGSADDPFGLAVRDMLQARGWRFSDEQIQFRNTVNLDLVEDEEALLSRMKSKTRYNIRLADRRGVTIRPAGVEDIDLLYQMYAHTALRDGFTIRSKAYYQAVWDTFFKAGLAEPLVAEVEGDPVGGAVIFRFGGRAWYMHGMSLDAHREKMFTYRLQWEAILRAKAIGCHTYDMWGAPDTFNEDDPLWGVFRFKEGFGGQVVRTLGAWDYPVRPVFYRGYCQVLPRLLDFMRTRGKTATRRSLNT